MNIDNVAELERTLYVTCTKSVGTRIEACKRTGTGSKTFSGTAASACCCNVSNRNAFNDERFEMLAVLEG